MITYFIKGGNFIKIGQSRNLKGRIASLQTSNPHRLSVIKTTRQVTECEAHATAANLTERKASEWFEETPELVAWIESLEHADWNAANSNESEVKRNTRHPVDFYTDLITKLNRDETMYLMCSSEERKACPSNFIDQLMAVHSASTPEKRAKRAIRIAMLEDKCRMLSAKLEAAQKTIEQIRKAVSAPQPTTTMNAPVPKPKPLPFERLILADLRGLPEETMAALSEEAMSRGCTMPELLGQLISEVSTRILTPA